MRLTHVQVYTFTISGAFTRLRVRGRFVARPAPGAYRWKVPNFDRRGPAPQLRAKVLPATLGFIRKSPLIPIVRHFLLKLKILT